MHIHIHVHLGTSRLACARLLEEARADSLQQRFRLSNFDAISSVSNTHRFWTFRAAVAASLYCKMLQQFIPSYLLQMAAIFSEAEEGIEGRKQVLTTRMAAKLQQVREQQDCQTFASICLLSCPCA